MLDTRVDTQHGAIIHRKKRGDVVFFSSSHPNTGMAVSAVRNHEK